MRSAATNGQDNSVRGLGEGVGAGLVNFGAFAPQSGPLPQVYIVYLSSSAQVWLLAPLSNGPILERFNVHGHRNAWIAPK